MYAPFPSFQMLDPAIPSDVEQVLKMALAKSPDARFARVEAFAIALEQACQPGLSTLPIATPTFLSSSSTALTLISTRPVEPSPSIAPVNTDPPNIPAPVFYQPAPGLTPSSPSHTPPASFPETVIAVPMINQPRRGISRRAVLGGLLGLAVVAGGVAWFTTEHLHSPTATNSKNPVTTQPTSIQKQSSSPTTNKPLIHQGAGKEYTVSWSPDGTKIASAGNGEIIEAWDSASGNSLFNLVSGAGTVYSVVWSPDGTKIASGQKNGTVKIWGLILTFGDTARLFPETDAAILVTLEEHESSVEWRYVYMYVSPLLPLSEGLLIERIDATETTLTVAVVSTAASAACPLCACSSARIHSHYTRSVADVACGGRQVKLVLSLRKFFCGTAICRRKIFTERLPDLVQPWARVTNRLLAALQALGLATSAQVSERLAPRLGMKVAAPTLLRCVRTIPDPPTAAVQMVGIDDWSLRRSQSYGTILVDLQSHRPIELLADRTAAAVLPWLKAHPDIDVVSRDRASAYADAAHKALPDAIQVADRFHVLKNLREHLQRFLERKRASLPFVEDTPLNKEPGLKAGSVPPTVISSSAVQLEAASPIIQQQSQHDDALTREHPLPPVVDPEIPLDALTAVERRQKMSRDKRVARYEEVLALHRAGMGQRAIARQLRISRKVVHRSVTAEAFPERLSGTGEGRTSKLAPYLSYVRERWDAGMQNGRLLFREIKARGYSGSHGLLARVIAEWRTELPARPMQGTPRKPRLVVPKGQRRLSSRQASWLLLSAPEKRTEVQRQLLEHICQESPELHTAYLLTQEFVTLLKERQPEMLDGWLTRAKESGVSELGSFVKGIQRDYAAVRAACSLPWSNGVVEGHVNRLKFIKRSMFGRAKLDLLRVKVLHQI